MSLDEANTMVSKSLLYHFKHIRYRPKTVSLKNAVFDISWPLTLKQLILGEIWRHPSERAFQELYFFRFGVAIIVPEIMAVIPDKTIIFRKFDLEWPLLTSIFTWAKKWPRWLRMGSLRAFERLIVRPSSIPSFLVRRGGHFAPPPPTMAKVAETATRARVNHAYDKFLPLFECWEYIIPVHRGQGPKLQNSWLWPWSCWPDLELILIYFMTKYVKWYNCDFRVLRRNLTIKTCATWLNHNVTYGDLFWPDIDCHFSVCDL